jgi:uncharacterized membrane protein YdjX (TVP38/TMEM64 family)
MENAGLWSILIFLFICMFRQIFLIPSPVVFISGGLIFGTLFGALYTIMGHMFNITVAYYIGRRFEHSIEGFISEKYLHKLRRAKEKGSFTQIFAMRATPGFPVDPISFGAGFVGMDFHQYLGASFLGSVPKIVLYAYLGQRLDNLFTLETMIALVFLLTLALMPYVIENRKEAL